MATTPSKPELIAENAELRTENKYLKEKLADIGSQRNGGTMVAILTQLIFWFGVCYTVTCAYLSVAALAGKTTITDMKVWASLSTGDIAEAFVVVVSVVYGFKQRTLRRMTVKEMGSRLEEFERKIDPNRTSSGLTPDGTTHPEDV